MYLLIAGWSVGAYRGGHSTCLGRVVVGSRIHALITRHAVVIAMGLIAFVNVPEACMQHIRHITETCIMLKHITATCI
jgi:hypothetical protein